MPFDEKFWGGEATFEQKLIRMIAGQLQLSLLLQTSPMLCGKNFADLNELDRQKVQDWVMQEVLMFASWASPTRLGIPPGGLPPSGKAH